VFLAVVALVLACGGDNDNAAGNDPQAILNSSVAAVGNVDSFHFRLDHENGSTPMPLSLDLTSAEGDIVVPDRLKAELRAKAVALNIRLDVIAIGDDTWITNPFSRRWERLPGAALTDIANPAALVSSLVKGLQGVQLAGTTDINGASTYHLQGTMDSTALAEALPIAQPGYSPSVDLYIGQSDSLPRRARISGPLSSGEADNIVRQVDFSRFNEPVTIQAP
jgi:hypothetical protein